MTGQLLGLQSRTDVPPERFAPSTPNHAASRAIGVADQADATIERAGRLMDSLGGEASTLERRLTVVKIAKPNQDMRFDVPVIGLATIEIMIRARASCLSVEAGRTLLFDRESLLDRANQAGIAIVASPRVTSAR